MLGMIRRSCISPVSPFLQGSAAQVVAIERRSKQLIVLPSRSGEQTWKDSSGGVQHYGLLRGQWRLRTKGSELQRQEGSACNQYMPGNLKSNTRATSVITQKRLQTSNRDFYQIPGRFRGSSE